MAEESGKERRKDGLVNILVVAVCVCLVCSVIVSTAAVALKPRQLANQALDRKQNILRAAGLLPADSNLSEDGRSVDELFAQFTVRAVDLETGRYIDGVDPATYDPVKAAKDPELSTDLEDDPATLGRRENVSFVYLLEDEEGLDKIVLPVRGYGLWGTLFGYLALDGDAQTIAGLGYYSHKETPGLGGEVDNPSWKAQWPGVQLTNDAGDPAVRLVKTRSASGSDAAAREVDALSGATMTSRGVQNMVNFWTGEAGFGPYLERLRTST